MASLLCSVFKVKFYVLLFLIFKPCIGENFSFPENFMFGVSTSSYQIEGAWNIDGKGENIWDRFTHSFPDKITDHSNGNVACDSYNKYKQDVQLLSDLGVDFYRFSISWSRILPTGYSNYINPAGIDYYNNLIDELIKYEIKPLVTMYHWDLPQPLQDLGGWPNPVLAKYFEDYARVVFEHFGDRVKMWLTFNEPKLICERGYGKGITAPGIKAPGIGEYLCGHTVLLAHANVYHMYQNYYKKEQQGEIGFAIHSEWFEPVTTNQNDVEAAERKLQFDFGWFGNPIFNNSGDYPSIMKERILFRSINQGYNYSRLPEFSQKEIEHVRGTYDFLGFNMYTASLVAHQTEEIYENNTGYLEDVGVKTWKDPKWPISAAKRLKVVPWGLQKLLKWIADTYGNISIIITENGYADYGEIEDYKRMIYMRDYLYYLLKSIHEDGVNVRGYSVWSFLDNFEWIEGYKEKYGLISVDFKSENRERVFKKSAYFYRDLIKARKLLWFTDTQANNRF